MTEEERKQRGEKSAVIVGRLVRIQLGAMGCGRFELGIKRDAGEMILREGQGAIEITGAVKWVQTRSELLLRAALVISFPTFFLSYGLRTSDVAVGQTGREE
jgi:hypothetical protein